VELVIEIRIAYIVAEIKSASEDILVAVSWSIVSNTRFMASTESFAVKILREIYPIYIRTMLSTVSNIKSRAKMAMYVTKMKGFLKGIYNDSFSNRGFRNKLATIMRIIHSS